MASAPAFGVTGTADLGLASAPALGVTGAADLGVTGRAVLGVTGAAVSGAVALQVFSSPVFISDETTPVSIADSGCLLASRLPVARRVPSLIKAATVIALSATNTGPSLVVCLSNSLRVALSSS